jgi:hypothetical protein
MRYLYHYSDQLFDSLKTREKQNKPLDPKVKTNFSDYDKHISFFLEPIPLDILPDIHHNKHPFYVAGKEVYEYRIPTVNLGIMDYKLVESPEKTKARYDTSIDDDAYFELMDKVNIANKYIGDKISDIEDLVDRFEGTTRNYFIKIPSYPDYEKMKTKYAPCVPHLMVYPKSGIVRYSSVSKKKFGNTKVKISNTKFLNW